MSNNIREQLMAKTANLPKPADFKGENKKDKTTRGPQTMPGITSALAAAQLRSRNSKPEVSTQKSRSMRSCRIHGNRVVNSTKASFPSWRGRSVRLGCCRR